MAETLPQDRSRGNLSEPLPRPSEDKPSIDLTTREADAFRQMTESSDIASPLENRTEANDFEPRSVLADMLRNGAERIASFLDNRVATKDERREARAERIERGTEIAKEIGGKTLRAAKVMGLVTLGVSALSMEASMNAGEKAGLVIRQKVVQIAIFAKERFKERALRKEAVARNKRYDLEAEAEEMNVRYDAEQINKRFDEETEAEAMNKRYDEQAEAERMNKRYDEQAEAERMNELYDQQAEAEKMNAEFDQARRDAALRKQIALMAKARRKTRRKEKYTAIREKGGDLAKKAGKGIGRIALKALKGTVKILGKTTKAALAGAKAAGSASKEAWRQA